MPIRCARAPIFASLFGLAVAVTSGAFAQNHEPPPPPPASEAQAPQQPALPPNDAARASQPQALASDDAARASQHPTTLPDMAEPATEEPTTLQDPDIAEPASDLEDDELPLRFELQLVGLAALPFQSSAGSLALGFGLVYGVGWGDIPVMLGADFLSADSLSRTKTQVEVRAGGQSLNATKTARERTLHFDLWARIQPPHWPVRPYVEGFIGTKVLQTSYRFDFGDDGTASDYAKDHDWTNSIGWGVGVDFLGLLSHDGQFSLTLGIRRSTGSHAELERSLQLDGHTTSATHSVATSVTMFMIGIGGRTAL